MTYKEFGATIAPSNVSSTGFPIAIGSHIGGGRTINGKNNLKLWQLLGDGADITEQKANAIGQIWYDTLDNKYWKLDSWASTNPVWVDVSTIFATKSYVDIAIENIPDPMIFKGSLGTGGTITSLPTASTSTNIGFTYKVITAGTYAGQVAKVGDTFISDGTIWNLIPSGDDSGGGSVTSITLNATSPILIDDSNAITTSGTRTFSHATTSGNKHIPSGGTTNQILRWTADGTAVWSDEVNTHYTSKNIVSSSATEITNTDTTNPYLNHIEESTITSSHRINGSGATTVSSDVGGNITISSTDTNTTYSFATGTTNGTFNVTPSGGSATAISIYGLGSAAYTSSTNYASSSHNHSVFTTTEDGFVPKSVTSNTTDFLRSDGSWASPSGTTYTLPLAASGTRGGIQIGYTPTVNNNLPLLLSSEKGYVTLTSASITTGLGYTPYNSTNPNAYTTNTGTVTSITLNATSPILIDNSAAIATSGTRTFSHASTSGNKHIPSGGSADNYLKWDSDGTATWSALPTASTSVAGVTTVGTSGGAASYVHTHGNITNDGAIGTTSGLMVRTTTLGVLTTLPAGSSGQFLQYDGTWATPTTYSLPLASNGTRGGVQIGYTATGADLPLKLDSEKGYITLTSSSITTALGYTPNTGTITSIDTGTGLTGGQITTTGTIALATAYGDTVNPYASKTAKYILAAPNDSNGVPSFRALVASDIPLNSITFNDGGTGDDSGITYNGSTAQTISYNTIGASPSNHNHDYTTLLNLPDIYHAYHNTAPNDFDSLYGEPNDVWLCSSSMYNGPSDYSGGTDTGYNNDFSSCVVQQFGEDNGMKIQVLYITTENVNNLNMGYIFYRIRGEDWQRIATYSDVANLQAQIDNLVNNLNNKQDKLSILADISLSANTYATIYPAANKVQYINLMGSTGTNTIDLNNYFNSLDEFTIIIHNPNSVGIAINLHSSYKFVGVQPSWSYNSWVICIWRGMIFANILIY